MLEIFWKRLLIKKRNVWINQRSGKIEVVKHPIMGSGFKQIAVRYGVYYWNDKNTVANKKYFNLKSQAFKFAKSYMRKH